MELKNLGQTAASALIHTDIRLEREHWTMFRNKILGIAAAATLGSAAMLGTTSANAVVDLDATATLKANPAITYAKETLKTKVDSDSTYYVIDGADSELDTTVSLGVAGAGSSTDDLLITFTLDGMVFTSNSSPQITGDITVTTPASGGKKGDSSVVFTADRGGATAENHVTLQVEDLGVSMSGGGISVTIINLQQRNLLKDVPGITNPGTKTASYPGAVAVASGIKPTATPKDLTARVERSFRDFGMTTGDSPAAILHGTLGSFMVALSSTATARHRNAADGTEIGNMAILINAGSSEANTPGTNSTVTIKGDFSFVDEAWLDDAAACDETDPADLRITTDGKVTDTTMLKKQSLAYVNLRPHLCIRVPAHTAAKPVSIPATGAYMAMTTYKAGTAGGTMLPADGSHDLGMVKRNGTTVRLPYLSTNQKFNQRIRIVNRGSNDARYELEFHGDDDTAGTDATGMLTAKSIKVLSLRTDDVVVPANGNNTSGTLIVEAQPGHIDVATVQINRETGNSDTVVYSAD